MDTEADGTLDLSIVELCAEPEGHPWVTPLHDTNQRIDKLCDALDDVSKRVTDFSVAALEQIERLGDRVAQLERLTVKPTA